MDLSSRKIPNKEIIMSVPAMNAKTVSMEITGFTHTTIIANFKIASGQYNLFSVPGVVDVSAIEASIASLYSAGTTRGAVTGAATIEVNLTDGGPTGDATGIAALYAIDTNTVTASFAQNVPVDSAGTSTTDLDADDWVNFHANTGSTGTTALGIAQVTVGYLYGKPASIN
jgi:hypothetical protein